MKYLIWANFKMNKTKKELDDYLDVFLNKYACFLDVDLVLAPVTSSLSWVSEVIWKSCLNLWAQNMHFDHFWAYTWEVSPDMLKELWCKYVIIWHSERRQMFGETNETVNKKILSAIENWIRPILCIWETLKQKELWLSKEVLKIQILEWLESIKDYSLVDIAYEPVWAIWTGKSATNEYINEIHDYIREIIWNVDCRIIYGGSVKAENAWELISIPNVNWFLVGSASLDPDAFLKIVQAVESK